MGDNLPSVVAGIYFRLLPDAADHSYGIHRIGVANGLPYDEVKGEEDRKLKRGLGWRPASSPELQRSSGPILVKEASRPCL
jgi:hypothetical protein